MKREEGCDCSDGCGALSQVEGITRGKGERRALRPGLPLIVVYGSSVAFGAGASFDYGWARMLRDAVAAEWNVVNEAVSGINTAIALSMFSERVGQHRPEYVVGCAGRLA